MAGSQNRVFTKSGDLVTVEIGEETLKLAHFKISKNRQELVAAKFLEIAGGASAEMTAKIKDFLTAQKLKKADIVNIIPSNLAIYKNIEVPSTDNNEIKQIIDLQAGAHTPYSKKELIISYDEIGVFHGRYTKILLVFVKRDLVTQRYDIIKKTGFKTEYTVLSFDFSAKLLFGMCPDATSEKPVAFVHIDRKYTDFSIVTKGKIVYIRSITHGAAELDPSATDTISKFIDELKSSLEFYQTEAIGDIPVKVYIAGSCSVFNGQEHTVEEALGVDTLTLPTENVVKLPQAVMSVCAADETTSLLPVFAPPLAPATTYLSLVPEDIRVKLELEKKSKEGVKLGILLMIVLILFCGGLMTRVFFKNVYYKKLLSSYDKENAEVSYLNAVLERSGIVKRFLSTKGEVLYVLTETFDALPPEVYLSSITFRDGNVLSFTGTAESMSQVFSLVTTLEDSKVFSNVAVEFTKSRRQQGKEVADFGLVLSIEEHL